MGERRRRSACLGHFLMTSEDLNSMTPIKALFALGCCALCDWCGRDGWLPLGVWYTTRNALEVPE
jgi:hypothetical protein